MARKGLIMDWGGVMTTSLFASFAAFDRASGLADGTVKQAFRTDPEARAALDDLECGRATVAQFEERFAAVLGLDSGDGLALRLFSGVGPDDAMLDAVEAFRAAGVRTGLLSNSWADESYDRGRFATLFDVLVISGEEGMRKPDPRIYELAVERMGLAAQELVFVDDIGGNLKVPRAMGIHTVLHVDAATTLAELQDVLGVQLPAAA
ncbi:HAD family hydrolase [Paraconexibacter algicola]|nr:HAD family phosphatase [Paraconexibacter algicola]